MTDLETFHRAREHARTEMAERIARDTPFSVGDVWLILDDLTEAEARQVCTLARRWRLSPSATCALLEEQIGDIHTVLSRRQATSGRRWAV